MNSENKPLDAEPVDEIDARELSRLIAGVDYLRRRPRMYMNGDLGSEGLHLVVLALIHRALAENAAGSGTDISVTLLPEDGFQIRDCGPGMPVRDRNGISLIELIATNMRGGHAQNPVTVASAFAERINIDVERHGRVWRQSFSRGQVRSPLSVEQGTRNTGTTIAYWPDPQIFSAATFDLGRILDRCRDLAGLHRSQNFVVADERASVSKQCVCFYPHGLLDYLRDLNQSRTVIHPTVCHFIESDAGCTVEVALQWVLGDNELLRSFACLDRTIGGTHETGFLDAVGQAIRNVAAQKGLPPIFDAAIRKGMTALISVQSDQIGFPSVSYKFVSNPAIRDRVFQAMNRHFPAFLQAYPDEADAILGRILLAK